MVSVAAFGLVAVADLLTNNKPSLKPGCGSMPQSSKAWYLAEILLPDLDVSNFEQAVICLSTSGMLLLFYAPFKVAKKIFLPLKLSGFCNDFLAKAVK